MRQLKNFRHGILAQGAQFAVGHHTDNLHPRTPRVRTQVEANSLRRRILASEEALREGLIDYAGEDAVWPIAVVEEAAAQQPHPHYVKVAGKNDSEVKVRKGCL